MTVAAKICGVSDAAAMMAAAEGGARWVGLVFYPPSPRAVTAEKAARLVGALPTGAGRPAVVGLVVDMDDAGLAGVLEAVPLDLLQLHGGETPERVAAIRSRFGVPVMKAIRIGGPEDLEAAATHAAVADRLLFDAKPPASLRNALPGGNAVSFDWSLLAGREWPVPWMLSGGLNPENLAEAVRVSGARAVDVSSGVEDRPGVKSPARIASFLRVAATL